ncbi:MAG: hypothetical protein FK733_07350 [Asgard group archaeon]|nr:hypothetical protein [Asgard group archaeon]
MTEDFKAFAVEFLKTPESDENLFHEKIISLEGAAFEGALDSIIGLSINDTIKKKEGLKLLTLFMKSYDSKIKKKAQIVNAIVKLKTYKAITVFVDFITETGPEKKDDDEAVKFYYDTKNAVFNVLTEMAWNKTKALNGLFRIAEIGSQDFQKEAVKRIKDLYSEKPKEELYQMITEEAQRQGENSLLYKMHTQL